MSKNYTKFRDRAMKKLGIIVALFFILICANAQQTKVNKKIERNKRIAVIIKQVH